MKNWIKTDTYNLASKRGKAGGSSNGHLMVSPYEVPQAIRAEKRGNMLVLELQYINISEPHSTRSVDERDVTFEIGDKSKRIYKVFVELDGADDMELDHAQLVAHINDAVKSLTVGGEKKPSSTKYMAATAAIKQYENDLLAGI